MNRILLIPLVFLFSCQSGPQSVEAARPENRSVKDSVPELAATHVSLNEDHDDVQEADSLDAYVTSWILVADTSHDYFQLREKMFFLKEKMKLGIDTMGREYNANKDLIALPEDDEDELYAGEYYPRRYVSQSLSLEYLDYYKDNALPKSIALVAGIFSDANEAQSTLDKVRLLAPGAFVVVSKVYMGCMH